MENRKTPKASINLENAIANFQIKISSFLQNISLLQSQTQQVVSSTVSRFSFDPFHRTGKFHPWARLSSHEPRQTTFGRTSLTTEAIEERLAGVPVFALSNSEGEFVLINGVSSGNSLGLFCFKEEDAAALLDQLKTVPYQSGTPSSKVVPLALNKVFQLKVNGVAFRFIPDSFQVKNAIEVKERDGDSDHGFTGVPVFQSKSLVLKSQGKNYRPMFFRKEDLDKSLAQASQEQTKLNPSYRRGDVQVAVFEEVIKCMKEGSNPALDDVVFIPPGFDVRAD